MSCVARSATIPVRAVRTNDPVPHLTWTGRGMTERAVSWTPATSATSERRVIMAHMISLAEMFSDQYFSGHETTRLHSDDGRGSRRWPRCPLTIGLSEETGSHRARDVRRPPRDGREPRPHPPGGSADRFKRAGGVARRAGSWLAFHNESYHQKPIDGKVPLDVFIERLDPAVTRLQLDVGNMLIGGGDPMQYLQKYPDRFWTFHLKDALPDRSKDTRLGKGMFDFKKFLAAVPSLEQKPAYVEQETATDAAGDLADARANFEYLHALEF